MGVVGFEKNGSFNRHFHGRDSFNDSQLTFIVVNHAMNCDHAASYKACAQYAARPTRKSGTTHPACLAVLHLPLHCPHRSLGAGLKKRQQDHCAEPESYVFTVASFQLSQTDDGGCLMGTIGECVGEGRSKCSEDSETSVEDRLNRVNKQMWRHWFVVSSSPCLFVCCWRE